MVGFLKYGHIYSSSFIDLLHSKPVSNICNSSCTSFSSFCVKSTTFETGLFHLNFKDKGLDMPTSLVSIKNYHAHHSQGHQSSNPKQNHLCCSLNNGTLSFLLSDKLLMIASVSVISTTHYKLK